MSNLFINKKQLSILTIGLMALTRDDNTFNFGIDNGIFTENDLYDYIETIRTFTNKIEEGNGVIISSEMNFDDIDHTDCLDLWGSSVDGGN